MADQFESYGRQNADTPPVDPSSAKKPTSFDNYVVPERVTADSLGKSSHELAGSQPDTDHAETPRSSTVTASPLTEGIESLTMQLDVLIGLRRVKEEVRRLIQFVRIQEMRRQHGISHNWMSLHSVFYGSPGTGKTTVARLYSRMLCAMGLLSRGHLVETDRAGLVGNYVGQTATRTDEKVKQALGGVLFIDEAYSLSKGEHSPWDYGSEAIEILVKRMEDHREDLVVIVAGYTEPMQRFLASNEGLRSRFSTYVYYDDYTPPEMVEIFRLFCGQENYEPIEEALQLVLAAVQYNYSNRDATFGNARFVRNLFEIVIKNQALRVGLTSVSPTVADLRLIQPEDVPLITPSDIPPVG